MRVLVTGAAGFIGQALMPLLLERGHALTATDRDCAALEGAEGIRIVEGDIAAEATRRAALQGADAVVHLATVPGGAAEEHPELARLVNVDATMHLSSEFACLRRGAPFVFASSIAVFGHPLPETVCDETPLAPQMIYGAHKAMMETWLATLSRRGKLAALSLRLPGIVARPPAPSGMKSAFMSDVFHALAAQRPIELPISTEATTWLMSVDQVARCLAHALTAATTNLPESRAITLPALRVSMGDLVSELARQLGADPALVSHKPDQALEQGFGRYPPLTAAAAERLGFSHDGDLTTLVGSALRNVISKEKP
jgi:nucleoside-diphosphate-sugar epimerase